MDPTYHNQKQRIAFMALDRRMHREALYNELVPVVLVRYRYMPVEDRKRVLQMIIHKTVEQDRH